MTGQDDDPVRKRAAEIRAAQAAEVRSASSRDSDLRFERARLIQHFLDALTEKTSHAVRCVALDERSYGAVAEFSFVRDGKVWTQIMFEFGIDRIDGETGSRSFLYYLEPAPAAFSISNPETGIARGLANRSEQSVVTYAVEISIEMMARVVASGGMIGAPAELGAAVAKVERDERDRQRAGKRERGRRFWAGCGAVIVWFLGVVVGIGVLGNALRACSGG